jgi:hypothetical protein
MTRWPRFVLTVEVRPPRAREGMPEPAPPILRLRVALKALLRAFGIKRIRIEPACGADPAAVVGPENAPDAKPDGFPGNP